MLSSIWSPRLLMLSKVTWTNWVNSDLCNATKSIMSAFKWFHKLQCASHNTSLLFHKLQCASLHRQSRVKVIFQPLWVPNLKLNTSRANMSTFNANDPEPSPEQVAYDRALAIDTAIVLNEIRDFITYFFKFFCQTKPNCDWRKLMELILEMKASTDNVLLSIETRDLMRHLTVGEPSPQSINNAFANSLGALGISSQATSMSGASSAGTTLGRSQTQRERTSETPMEPSNQRSGLGTDGAAAEDVNSIINDLITSFSKLFRTKNYYDLLRSPEA